MGDEDDKTQTEPGKVLLVNDSAVDGDEYIKLRIRGSEQLPIQLARPAVVSNMVHLPIRKFPA
jgi:hypothetical protein